MAQAQNVLENDSLRTITDSTLVKEPQFQAEVKGDSMVDFTSMSRNRRLCPMAASINGNDTSIVGSYCRSRRFLSDNFMSKEITDTVSCVPSKTMWRYRH